MQDFINVRLLTSIMLILVSGDISSFALCLLGKLQCEPSKIEFISSKDSYEVVESRLTIVDNDIFNFPFVSKSAGRDESQMEIKPSIWLQTTLLAVPIVADQQSRLHDHYGNGQYGASRDGGVRKHNGIDIVVDPGEKIYSPITGDITRETMPYRNDKTYKGIVIKGTDKWKGYEIKIFYVEGLFNGAANESQEIGIVQDLNLKYPSITNHIHVEAKYLGIQIDPFELWQYSF